MTENPNGKQYDLEDRTLAFAKSIRSFIKKIPKTIANMEDIRQLIRASGSIGANYIEANEALGKKDFLMRIRISRKESKESRFWLGLVEIGKEGEIQIEHAALLKEATELMLIFSSIMRKSS